MKSIVTQEEIITPSAARTHFRDDQVGMTIVNYNHVAL